MKLIASNPWSQLAEGASGHFERLYKGQPSMPRTPLYKGDSTRVIFERWLDILKKYAAQYPDTIAYDMSRKDKIGPRGGYPPWSDRKAELEKYATRLREVDLSNPNLKAAVDDARKFLGITGMRGLRPISARKVLNRDIFEDKVQTNSGCPDFSKRSRPEVQTKAVSDAETGVWKSYPYVIAERTQRHGKTRFIFMAPMSSNLIEKGFILPLFDRFRDAKHPELSAWEGFDAVENYGPSHTDTEYVSTDFTGMDQTVGPSQLSILFSLLDGVYQDNAKMREVLGNCITANVQVEYLKAWAPPQHGLPSGAGGTNFYETLLAVIMHFLAMRLSGQTHRFQVLGDDGVAFGASGLADSLLGAAELMGFDMNPEKQRVSSKEYVYLQRYFNPKELGSFGAYPTIQALNACVYPERFHNPDKWGPRMESLRWIMILENCKHHPAFHDLIDYVKNGDKYKLDLGSNASSLYEEAKAIPGFVPSYNQASITRKLDDFETIKYLRSKA